MQTYYSQTAWGRRRAEEATKLASREALLLFRVVEEPTRAVGRLEQENAQLRGDVERRRADLGRHAAAH